MNSSEKFGSARRRGGDRRTRSSRRPSGTAFIATSRYPLQKSARRRPPAGPHRDPRRNAPSPNRRPRRRRMQMTPMALGDRDAGCSFAAITWLRASLSATSYNRGQPRIRKTRILVHRSFGENERVLRVACREMVQPSTASAPASCGSRSRTASGRDRRQSFSPRHLALEGRMVFFHQHQGDPTLRSREPRMPPPPARTTLWPQSCPNSTAAAQLEEAPHASRFDVPRCCARLPSARVRGSPSDAATVELISS